MKKHFIELDSLRGLAALSVLIGHFIFIYPFTEPHTYNQASYEIWNIVKYSPLHIFFAGHEAVLMFFLLSGFVLSLPYYKKDFSLNSTWCKNYLIKRFFRIYIPYFVATMISIFLIIFLNPVIIDGASAFVNRIWTGDLSISNIISHIFLIGSFETKNINPVIWSLVHEMRISIIFPLIMLVILKFGNLTNILIALSISLFSFLSMYIVSPNGPASFLYTPHYVSIFMIGALLAKNIDLLTKKIKNMNKIKLVALTIFAVICYTYSWLFFDFRLMHLHTIVNEWFVVIGASTFILLALSTNIFSKILHLRPLHYLGKISYSLYLYHVLALLSVIHLYGNYDNKPTILLISFVFSVVAAVLSYHFIELPSIKLGRQLTKPVEQTENTKAL